MLNFGSWDVALQVLGWIIAAGLLVHLLPMVIAGLRPLRFRENPTDKDSVCPAVTIVMAARNEQGAIHQSLASLLQLQYPNLQIVAVDDRSTDQTGAIMDKLAVADERLVVAHITELPAGWLGKNHANWIGASQTESDWLLFTDGDVLFQPDALRRAIRHVRHTGVDHLALYPGMIPGGMWENLMICTFGLLFSMRFKPWLARTRYKHAYIGIGAFNLVSRHAYQAIGTHQRLALEVTDDLKLGKLVKAHDFRQDVCDGREVIQVRWQVGLRGVIRGLEKNMFAGLEYSLPNLIVVSCAYVAAFLLPYLLPWLLSPATAGGFIAGLAMLHLAFAFIVRRQGFNVLMSLLLPLPLVLFLYIMWRSAILTLRQGGIVWRDTFYPLEELRKGVV